VRQRITEHFEPLYVGLNLDAITALILAAVIVVAEIFALVMALDAMDAAWIDPADIFAPARFNPTAAGNMNGVSAAM
jgi:hypothetical protein